MSKKLLPSDFLLTEIKKIASNLKISKIEQRKIYNRDEFIFYKGRQAIKLEFIYYPFSSLKPAQSISDFKIKVESQEDIATNKVHSVFERSEPKDIFDLYCLIKKCKFSFSLLFKWVERKFGVGIDSVIFASRALKAIDNLKKIKPLLIKKSLYNLKKMRRFFEKEALEYLRKKIK